MCFLPGSGGGERANSSGSTGARSRIVCFIDAAVRRSGSCEEEGTRGNGGRS